MTLKEMLSTSEAKKMYRELAMKHHPDKGGSAKIMKRINDAKGGPKDYGDDRIKKLYKDLIKEEKPKKEKKKAFDDIKHESKAFDLEEAIKKVQDEMNENAKKVGVNDRVFIMRRGDGLSIVYTHHIGGVQTLYMKVQNLDKYKNYATLKKAIINFILKYI